jgi:hypothetical protein
MYKRYKKYPATGSSDILKIREARGGYGIIASLLSFLLSFLLSQIIIVIP